MSKVNWSESPDGADVALTTGPDWNANSIMKGDIEFAAYSEGEYLKPHSTAKFVMGNNAWVVLEHRPKNPVTNNKEKPESTHSKSDTFSDGDKYVRTIFGMCGKSVQVDVYRVLDAYPSGDAALDHAIKKMLCAGQRGHKDKITDYENAIESMQKALVLLQQKELANK